MVSIEKIHLEHEKLTEKIKKIEQNIKHKSNEMKMQKKYGHKHHDTEKFAREISILTREKRSLIHKLEKLKLKEQKVQAKLDKKKPKVEPPVK
ncbi:hypothetical protein NEF87_004118 [Candidatus Lokiarchaeum ossiferum]|uniref:Uncharacterized protein n=1 Tax=Candidatus Lokiarchaeum ossiferum TaxID=2951803 RepID=A0ABY6HWC0_9ARCH|nr:hypothetical protein NEF87_004118 [Candidatus Lokiarchaeum sp. B-35]